LTESQHDFLKLIGLALRANLRIKRQGFIVGFQGLSRPLRPLRGRGRVT
jgi:hypothetical protein